MLPKVASFTVASDDVCDGEPMPAAHSKGDGVSPHLRWRGAPKGTKSYAVTCFDPDAPIPSGFWHWVVVDIPASEDVLARGAGAPDGKALPKGAFHCRNDYGSMGYGGAMPPKGDRAHRYFFVVHALGVEKLAADENSTPAMVGLNLVLHTLARAIIVPTFIHRDDSDQIRGSQGPGSRVAAPALERPMGVGERLGLLISLAAAAAAAWAAFETWKTADEARRATRATVLHELLSEYGSAETLESMKNLRSWQRRHPTDFSSLFGSLLETEPEGEVKRLDADRRRVASFFSEVRVFADEGIIDPNFVAQFWGQSTYEFLRDVLVPLQCAKALYMLNTHAMSPVGASGDLEDCEAIGQHLPVPAPVRSTSDGLLAFFTKLLPPDSSTSTSTSTTTTSHPGAPSS
jgi:Raf kinase inhibitor-like YbhB/YbcL family protein